MVVYILYRLLTSQFLYKKDSYPLPRIQEALESLVGTGHFSCLDLKPGFWQIKMDESLKQYTMFTVGNLGFSSVIACLLGFAILPPHSSS